MSTSTIAMESEQNERPTNGSPMGQRGSDTRVSPNTEEDEDINYPWTDCLLNEESDESSSINIPNYRKDIQYNYVTLVSWRIFRTMKKSQWWNNYPVVEYPVVNLRGVSNIWNGALTI